MQKTIVLMVGLLFAPVIVWAEAVRILGSEHIPVPVFHQPAIINTVYSPSVARDHAGNLVMAFGVGILCNGGQVYVDSIGLARTPDGGQSWVFDRWLILGPSWVCHVPISAWPPSTQWQFNDPHLWRASDGLMRMVYTVAEWPACGNIGMAAWDAYWNPVFRNDEYYSSRGCATSAGRPTVEFTTNGTLDRLWFDSLPDLSGGQEHVWSVPMTRLDQLPSPSPDTRLELPTETGLSFGNLHIVTSEGNHNVTVQGDGRTGIQEMERVDGQWRNEGPPFFKGRIITSQTGHDWDAGWHGSPMSFEGVLYFAGFTVQALGSIATWRGASAVPTPPAPAPPSPDEQQRFEDKLCQEFPALDQCFMRDLRNSFRD